MSNKAIREGHIKRRLILEWLRYFIQNKLLRNVSLIAALESK